MTMLDKFLSFARRLPADRLESVEQSLAALMESLSDRFDFTPEELAEIDRRVAHADPQYSNPDDIAEIFGQRFTA